MGNSSTSNKSFNDPDDGEYARKRLGSWLSTNWGDLDTVLGRFEREEHTLSDTGKASLFGGNAVHAMGVVINEDDNDIGAFFFQGDGNAVVELGETGAAFGVGSEGTDAQTNLYWDSGNTRYELENQAGGEKTYEVISLRSR